MLGWRRPGALSLGVVASDQAATYLARSTGRFHADPYFPLLQNAWGWLAVALALAILVRLPRLRPGLALAAAGFASNLLSRALYGGFTDYLPTGISYVNVADLAVMAGCLAMAVELLRAQENRP